MVAGPPPLLMDAPESERRELIKENRDLQVRLRRAERATQGLQLGYEEMNEREREVTQDLKFREIELADCREILRIQTEDLDSTSNELQTFKKKSTKSFRGLKEQRDAALE